MKLFDKIFKPSKTIQPSALTAITRTEVLEGFSIPGIIYNMQYHFTDLEVYSDGLMSCWGMVDLEILKDKINKNWVVSSIPDGQAISIFSLGYWHIDKGQWEHTKESLYDYIFSLVKKLNPTLENLHNYHGNSSKSIGKANVAKHFLPNPKPYYLDNPESFLPKRISGEKFAIFYVYNRIIYLAQLSIYKNGHIEITNIPEKKTYRFDDLQELINKGQITSSPKIGETIVISGLGSFVIKSGDGIDIHLKYSEFTDKFNELNGKENSIAKCARIFNEYKALPTKKNKGELKEAYEAVPEHQRIFVGTMDTKDYEIRLIIYGDIEKERWEEEYGYEYPFDDMPKPIDE